MLDSEQEDFDAFAGRFVRIYMKTVKSGEFPMPPYEPVQESVEELIADVSYSIEPNVTAEGGSAVFELHLTSKLGDWWRFGFKRDPKRWKLINCTARSDDEAQPHDLLDAVYSQYFRPLLVHATDVANSQRSK